MAKPPSKTKSKNSKTKSKDSEEITLRQPPKDNSTENGRSVQTRSRSKRSNEPNDLGDQPPTKLSKRMNDNSSPPSKSMSKTSKGVVKKPTRSSAVEKVVKKPMESDEVIVGSSKSLINSLKRRKAAIPSREYEVKRNDVNKVTRRNEQYEINENDGVEVDVNASDDDLSDGQVQSSSESESEEEQPTESSNEESYEGSESGEDSPSDDEHTRHVMKQKNRRQGDNVETSESEGELENIEAEIKSLKRDPKVNKLLEYLVDEKLANERERRWRRRGTRDRSRTRSRYRSRSRTRCRSRRRGGSARRSRSRSIARRSKSRSKGKRRFKNAIKSPSDTTLYRPALRKLVAGTVESPFNRIPTQNNVVRLEPILNTMSRFSDGQGDPRRSHSRSRDDDRQHHSRERTATPRELRDPEEERASELAEQMVLDAEKFRATVTAPKPGMDNTGVSQNIDLAKLSEIVQRITDNDDDDYFHVTSHIDQTLKSKIEKGLFVELERLLPKTRTQLMTSSQRWQQFVNNEDGTLYWGPPENTQKISSVRKWEQAFRVYAAVYCAANPSRSPEIWQYVYVINAAAASYAWENVAYYDFTFRQLMSEKPHRSWAKTYTQLWNLAMCDPINKSSLQQPSTSNHTAAGDDWKARCCWRFNKGNCKSWNCKYDHRCTSCGSWTHAKKSCFKKKGNSSSGSNSKDYNVPNKSPNKKKKSK